jgi:hypothetical protein
MVLEAICEAVGKWKGVHRPIPETPSILNRPIFQDLVPLVAYPPAIFKPEALRRSRFSVIAGTFEL